MDFNNIPFPVLSVSAFREWLDQLWKTLLLGHDARPLVPDKQSIERNDYKAILSFFLHEDVVSALEPALDEMDDASGLSAQAYSTFARAMGRVDFHQPHNLQKRWDDMLSGRKASKAASIDLLQDISTRLSPKLSEHEKAAFKSILQINKKKVEALGQPFVKNILASAEDDSFTAELLDKYGIHLDERDEIRMVLALLWVWISALPHQAGAEQAHHIFITQLQESIRLLCEFSIVVQKTIRPPEFIEKILPQTINGLASQSPATQFAYTENSCAVFNSNTNDHDHSKSLHR